MTYFDRVREVLLAFLRLGCISFGGPVAHLGYFQKELVERRQWCTEETYAECIALAQSLPGPGSSQVAFTLGLLRAGLPGGLAAWVGFTAPSAFLMIGFALGHQYIHGAFGSGAIHGLQLVSVAVIAQAIQRKQRTLAPDGRRMALALLAMCIVLFGAAYGTVLSIAVGALLGFLLLRNKATPSPNPLYFGISKTAGMAAALCFVALLILLPWAAEHTESFPLSVVSAFYRTGALVFGGGHVVLPLLENAVVAKGWISQEAFLAGYGAAQAIPGPLFTFAAYLGAAVHPNANPILLGLLSLVAIFGGGVLLLLAALRFWLVLRNRPAVQASLQGVNASVVGVLLAAFFSPVWRSTVHTNFDFAAAATAFSALTFWRWQPWMVVLAGALISGGVGELFPTLLQTHEGF